MRIVFYMFSYCKFDVSGKFLQLKAIEMLSKILSVNKYCEKFCQLVVLCAGNANQVINLIRSIPYRYLRCHIFCDLYQFTYSYSLKYHTTPFHIPFREIEGVIFSNNWMQDGKFLPKDNQPGLIHRNCVIETIYWLEFNLVDLFTIWKEN